MMSIAPIYQSRIIKASALIADTRVLLANWDFSESVEVNLSRARDENVFAKASRSRVEDILQIFRQRYFADPQVGEALAVLASAPGHGRSLDRLLYYHSARADRLLYDTVCEFLYPRHASGLNDLPSIELKLQVQEWVNAGLTTTSWGTETVERVTQGLLATLRDFGVLEGAVNKRIANIALPVEAFALIARTLVDEGIAGDRLAQHPDWRLFFLSDTAVERLFAEAHQRHYLEYHAAGSVVRVTFPSDNRVEMARDITR